MSNTVMRYIAMLKHIPSHTGGITATDLHRKLGELGYEIDKRGVERDLLTLSGAFPITNDEGRPARWHWMRDAPFTALPGMDPVTALTLELVSRYLTPLLPPRALQPLVPQIVAARQVLDEFNGTGLGRWASRIVVVPQGQPLLAPNVAPEVTAAVYESLCAGKRVEVSYRAVGAERAKRYPISPLGLVVRGGVIYLVGTARDYGDPCVYALHRMSNAVPLNELATTPPGFDLEHYVREEHTFEFPQGKDIRLELNVSAFLANHLSESRLAADQQIKPMRGSERWHVQATVANTEQLIWWLLGFGAQVEIVRPASLRKRMARQIALLAKKYGL